MTKTQLCPTQHLIYRTVALNLTHVFQLFSLCLMLMSLVTGASNPDPLSGYHDYCIVGAGPAGLQMGYFLQQTHRDYIIFERSNVTGNFFVDYPRHRKLISINKRYTGKTNKEFNLRHDWNSLISHDQSLLFGHYSNDMFPHADRMLVYLKDFQEKLGIRVQFNTEIRNIHNIDNASVPDGVSHHFEDQNGNQYSCKILILATGMWKPNIPDVPGMNLTEGYESLSLDPQHYEGKSVLILGRGNAAFEVADGIYGVTNLIHMISRSRVRLSWETHYVGDLRAVNNALLDTYQLKSLDGLLEAGLGQVLLVKEDDKIMLKPGENIDLGDNFAMREPYDKVIRCLGFVFDSSLVHNKSHLDMGRGRMSKYPSIGHNYESTSMPGVFVAGTASHSLDWRKSSGGFIHGFRYTARALHRLLNWRYEGEPWPVVRMPITQLLNFLVKRMNDASGLYQMFQMLGDVITFTEDGTMFDFYEEFPINLLHEFSKHTGRAANRTLVVVLEYGADFSGPGKDIFRYNRATGSPSHAHKSNFLHPVLYYYEQLPTKEQMEERRKKEVLPRPSALHHVVEDFLTNWDGMLSHLTPLEWFLNHITQNDLRLRFAQQCFAAAMLHTTASPMCADGFLQGQGLTASSRMLSTGDKLLKDGIVSSYL